MSFSLVVLLIVFLGIALRQVLRIRIAIWQMMSMGALVVLLSGHITLAWAWQAINWPILGFLWGMFYVGQSLEESGVIHRLTQYFFHKNMTTLQLSVLIVFGMGLLSGILMNDTIAIIATPLLLTLARQNQLLPNRLLLLLAFSITIGSVLSPMGNPQNLLIALGVPIQTPFTTFLRYLALPTVINLILLWVLSHYFFIKPSKDPPTVLAPCHTIYHKKQMISCLISIVLILLMVMYNIVFSFLPKPVFIPFVVIALVPAFFLLMVNNQRVQVLKKLDWHTLIFFIALFVLMQSVWDSISIDHIPVLHTGVGIMAFSALLSQLISNVPMVSLYLPILKQGMADTPAYLALAAGSTIAGNLLIFGAASNFIILQNAQKRGGIAFGFFEFARFGIPLTCLNLAVYWACLFL